MQARQRSTTTTTFRLDVTSQWRPFRRTGDLARSRRCHRAARSETASGFFAWHTPQMTGSRPASSESRRSGCRSPVSPACLASATPVLLFVVVPAKLAAVAAPRRARAAELLPVPSAQPLVHL